MRAIARAKLTTFNQLTSNYIENGNIIIKKNGVFAKKKNYGKKFGTKIKKMGNLKKIEKKNFAKKYFETKIVITKTYNTINQCDTIFALRGLLLSKFSNNQFFFYVKMFLSIMEILS